MDNILVIVHIAVAASLIGLVLIQQGKGADMGAAFGSGASQTVFGSTGSGSFLTRTTGILATVFFITSLSLAYFSGQANTSESVVDQGGSAPASISVPAESTTDAPVIPEEPGAGNLPPE